MSRLRLRTAAASTNPMTRRSLRRAPLQQDSCLLASSAVYPIPFVFTRVHSQLKVCVLPIRRRGYRSEIRRAMILSNSLCEPIRNQYAVSPRTRARAPYCSPIRIHQRPGASCFQCKDGWRRIFLPELISLPGNIAHTLREHLISSPEIRCR